MPNGKRKHMKKRLTALSLAGFMLVTALAPGLKNNTAQASHLGYYNYCCYSNYGYSNYGVGGYVSNYGYGVYGYYGNNNSYASFGYAAADDSWWQPFKLYDPFRDPKNSYLTDPMFHGGYPFF